jgi:hypothetical protein
MLMSTSPCLLIRFIPILIQGGGIAAHLHGHPAQRRGQMGPQDRQVRLPLPSSFLIASSLPF